MNDSKQWHARPAMYVSCIYQLGSGLDDAWTMADRQIPGNEHGQQCSSGSCPLDRLAGCVLRS
jgi:hypothetical protein